MEDCRILAPHIYLPWWDHTVTISNEWVLKSGFSEKSLSWCSHLPIRIYCITINWSHIHPLSKKIGHWSFWQTYHALHRAATYLNKQTLNGFCSATACKRRNISKCAIDMRWVFLTNFNFQPIQRVSCPTWLSRNFHVKIHSNVIQRYNLRCLKLWLYCRNYLNYWYW